jgi:peptidoglycan/xylan/chitin deacetylase (PgdA/CDA1 family)
MGLILTIDVEYPERPGADPFRVLDEILAVIDRYDVPVTFLVQGRWAAAHPDRVKELARRDPTLGLHGHTHIDYRRLTSDGVKAELRDGLTALRSAIPDHEARWTRLPYGWGATDTAIAPLLREAGLTPLGWDYSSFDWDASLSDESAVTRLLPAAERGGVLLMHSWPTRTPYLLEALLAATPKGFVVPLAETDLPGRAIQGIKLHRDWVDPPRSPQ